MNYTELHIPLEGLTALTTLTVNGVRPQFTPRTSQDMHAAWVAGKLPSLQHLDLSTYSHEAGDMLRSIPLLQRLTALKYLSLGGNVLASNGELVFASYVQNIRSLEHLDLSSIVPSWDNCKPLTSWISAQSQLTYLHLSGHCVCAEAELGPVLGRLSESQHLKLTDVKDSQY